MHRPVAALAIMVVVLAALPSGAARAERVRSGDLEVALNGGLAPLTLPRDRLVPIALTLAGRIDRVGSSGPPPQLRRLQVDVAGQGTLVTRGLAVCPRSRLANADRRQALQRCGQARVGWGWLGADIAVPHQPPFPLHGSLTAFNGRTEQGRPAIWLHLSAPNPPVAFVFPLRIERKRHGFRTKLTLRLPRALGGLPHLTGFSLTLWRRFRHQGREQSYLNGSCPLPPALPAGVIDFAHGTFSFAGGRQVEAESIRSCRARSE